MFGLTNPQLACFCIGFISIALAWWISHQSTIAANKQVAVYLSTIMGADVVGVLIQWYVVKGSSYGHGSALVHAAREIDTATYIGWPVALAALSAIVFDGGRVGRWVAGGVGGVWVVVCTFIVVTYARLGDSVVATTAHQVMVDRLFTAGHLIGVIIGLVLGVRYYLQKRWPLLPHLTTTILVLGAVSDCAAMYARATPSTDYDLSSIVGILVYMFVVIAQGYTIWTGGK
jgi:hypothetical protein